MYQRLTDSELLTAYHQGDKIAFEELYHRYWGILFKHARDMTGDIEKARDVVHDVFYLLLTKSNQIDVHKNIAGYLYTSLRNRIIDISRREKVSSHYLKHLERYNLSEFNYTDEEVLFKREAQDELLRRRIESEITNLPPKMRTAFQLSRNENLSYRQISERTGTAEGTIKKQIHHALQILRKKLLLGLLSFFL